MSRLVMQFGDAREAGARVPPWTPDDRARGGSARASSGLLGSGSVWTCHPLQSRYQTRIPPRRLPRNREQRALGACRPSYQLSSVRNTHCTAGNGERTISCGNLAANLIFPRGSKCHVRARASATAPITGASAPSSANATRTRRSEAGYANCRTRAWSGSRRS